MMKRIFLTALLFASPVAAQQLGTTQPPASPEYVLKLTEAQVRMLAFALQDQQYRDRSALLAEMQRQVNEQTKVPTAAAETPK